MRKILCSKVILILFFTFLSLRLICCLGKAQGSPEEGSMKKVEYTSQDLRDPFQSPFEVISAQEQEEEIEMMEQIEELPLEVGLPHIQVQGMIWDSEAPQAIINNTVVGKGELVEDIEILDIRKEGIYVLYEGNRYILRPTISSELRKKD